MFLKVWKCGMRAGGHTGAAAAGPPAAVIVGQVSRSSRNSSLVEQAGSSDWGRVCLP